MGTEESPDVFKVLREGVYVFQNLGDEFMIGI